MLSYFTMSATKYFFTLFALLIFSVGMNAQITVTGHVSAEIVEAASATSGTNDLLSLQQNAAPDNLDLGSITLGGGSNSICSVVVNAGQLTGKSGNSVNFSASSILENNAGILSDRGSGVFQFRGTADAGIMNQNENNYTGQYNVIFAYN
jgi:hypothetical protein